MTEARKQMLKDLKEINKRLDAINERINELNRGYKIIIKEM